MEVEYEEQTCSLKHNHFVAFVLQTDVGLGRGQPPVLLLKVLHGGIELIQPVVAQELVVDKVELTSRVVVRIVVSGTRKVEPLWVTKFVP